MKARVVRRWAGSLLGVALLAASACSGSEPADPEPSSAVSESESESSVDPEQIVRDACLSSIPPKAEIEAVTLEGATDGRIQAVLFPSGGKRVALVLLPQVGGGVCGWGRFAHEVAKLGFPSIVVAPCLYGESTCSDEGDADPLNEVAPAIAAAREAFGTERVVLMGASMGGSLTVLAAAGGADVDAWIDVSGPPAWEETDLLPLADSLPAEGLVVFARSDGASAYTQARQLAKRSGVRFLDGGSGHGYELLGDYTGRISRVGRTVLAFAKG